MDYSLKILRRNKIFQALDKCDSQEQRIELLVNKVLDLQNSLCELQDAYTEMLISYRNLCVQTPF